jgi:hypothetical protein
VAVRADEIAAGGEQDAADLAGKVDKGVFSAGRLRSSCTIRLVWQTMELIQYNGSRMLHDSAHTFT